MGCLLMISLFKKKESNTQKSMPPLPDDLEENNSMQNDMLDDLPPLPGLDENSSKTQNTHDSIPNDISVNPNRNNSFSPENLPELEEDNDSTNDTSELSEPVPEGMMANESMDLPSLPTINSNRFKLPEIPNVDADNTTPNPGNPSYNRMEIDKNNNNQKFVLSNEISEPKPEMDDSIPEPPAIFSEEGFYNTPSEVKHLVKEKDRYVKTFDEPTETTDDYQMERIEISRDTLESLNKSMNYDVEGYNDNISDSNENFDLDTSRQNKNNGPIFVDINSFKTMLDGVDTIKQDIKKSEDILQSLNKIKDSKDKELERWRLQLEDIQRKISYVDKVIFNEA